jgi:biotin-(acetyl-CoA carboxylase) ligase
VAAPRERVLAALLAAWEEAWRLWRAHGWEALAGEWAAYDALAGQRCRLTRAGQAYEGVVLGLSPDGALRLSLGPGKHMDFHSAEVEHLRPAEAGPGH